jgi:Na+-translocating ferredoxin:NAD+ oxidoreductase subunit E
MAEPHTIDQATDMDTFLRGLSKENPVFIQMLGLCPVLAVSNTVLNSLVMGLATMFVMFMSALFVSSFRNLIPKQVRIATYILIIATFVTMADYVIPAISFEVHRSLGAFIALIVCNCVILGRAEAFASKNSVGRSLIDALGMGAGFTVAILALGVVRELLGNGTLLGYAVLGPNFEPWVVMVLPAGAFFVLAGWLLLFNWLSERKKARDTVRIA